jgi:hypothetical protein
MRALALYYDGFASYSHQPAAIYKTRAASPPDLAAHLTMSPQAVLYVKGLMDWQQQC